MSIERPPTSANDNFPVPKGVAGRFNKTVKRIQPNMPPHGKPLRVLPTGQAVTKPRLFQETKGRQLRGGFEAVSYKTAPYQGQSAAATLRAKHKSRPKPKTTAIKNAFPWIPTLLLIAAAIIGALSLLQSQTSLKLGGVALAGASALFAASASKQQKSMRLSSLATALGLFCAVALTYLTGQSLNWEALSPNHGIFWSVIGILSLALSVVFKSRIALIGALACTSFWAYFQFTGYNNSSSVQFLLPALLGCCIYQADKLHDHISLRLSKIISLAWLSGGLYWLWQNNLASLSLLLNAALLISGAYYALTTQSLDRWSAWKGVKGHRLSTAPLAWFMSCVVALAVAWQWLYPNLLPKLSDHGFVKLIWLVTLIVAIPALVLLSAKRDNGYHWTRRILGAVIISAIAITLYSQDRVFSALFSMGLPEPHLFASLAVMATCFVLALNKMFMAAVVHGNTPWVLYSLVLIGLIGVTAANLPPLSEGLTMFTAAVAGVTASVLALTAKYKPTRNIDAIAA